MTSWAGMDTDVFSVLPIVQVVKSNFKNICLSILNIGNASVFILVHKLRQKSTVIHTGFWNWFGFGEAFMLLIHDFENWELQSKISQALWTKHIKYLIWESMQSVKYSPKEESVGFLF